MAAAVISGTKGGVTFATGYATNAFSWRIRLGINQVDNTPFAPTNNWATAVTDSANLLKRWDGSYSCRSPVTAATTIAVASKYCHFPHRYDLSMTGASIKSTVFTGVWESYATIGLKRVSGSYTTYIDDTNAMPMPGESATATFTVSTGNSYAMTVLCGEGAEATVSVAEQPSFTIPFVGSGDVTVTGTLPEVGATGSATFTAAANQTYGGTILVTGVRFSADVNSGEGQFDIDFVGSDTLAPV
jgi:hypothetical protein